MHISPIPFQTINWDEIERVHHAGEQGSASWRTVHAGNIRIRMVEYSPGYIADHWCNKGHIIFCMEGEMVTELKDGRKISMQKGMTYFVGDDSDPHRSSSEKGVSLFIVD